jgi:hypothetical protein
VSHPANLADPEFRLSMMRDTVVALRDQGTLWYPLLNVIATLIDGLASGRKGGTKVAYLKYINANLPMLAEQVGAELFCKHFRNPTIHQYALADGFAIGRNSEMPGMYLSSHHIPRLESSLTVLNIELLVQEFLSHLDELLHQHRSQNAA